MFLAVVVGSAITAARAQANYNQEFEQGVKLYKQKEYRQAADAFWQSILDGNPTANVWLYAANSYYGLGEKVEAIRRYRYVVDTFRGSPEAIAATKYLRQIDPYDKCTEKFGAGPVFSGHSQRTKDQVHHRIPTA